MLGGLPRQWRRVKLLRQRAQPSFTGGRNRTYLQPGKDMQGVQVPIHHCVITDPTAHRQLGLQQRWHPLHRQPHIRLVILQVTGKAEDRRRLNRWRP